MDAIFSSAFLSMHLQFELFLEDLFYSCITGNSNIADCEPEIKFANRNQAEQIFFGGVAFPIWMPYANGAEEIAKRAFVGGGPFARLQKQSDERKFLKDLTALRNAIAHQSSTALKKVEPLTSAMNPRRRTPAGYLQNLVQGETQYSLHSASLLGVASALSKTDLASAKKVMSPEDEYQKDEQTSAGRYQCVSCGKYKTLRAKRGKLGSCTRCLTLAKRPKAWRRVY
ncbi:hypothetical protein [Rhodococcus sp. 24CO]|uniref:hypothetical protein n=1 Tax=Rhodococcus sp. 24CO TaxID=3117460 RepID=UPI003D341DBF